MKSVFVARRVLVQHSMYLRWSILLPPSHPSPSPLLFISISSPSWKRKTYFSFFSFSPAATLHTQRERERLSQVRERQQRVQHGASVASIAARGGADCTERCICDSRRSSCVRASVQGCRYRRDSRDYPVDEGGEVQANDGRDDGPHGVAVPDDIGCRRHYFSLILFCLSLLLLPLRRCL